MNIRVLIEMKLILFLKKVFRILLKTILVIIGVIFIFFLIYAGLWEWAMYKPLTRSKFSSEQWKLAKIKVDGHVPLERRCGMYHDLTRNHLKSGMSIKEVEDLLGPVDQWDYCKDKKVKCMNYGMGVCYSNMLTIVPMSLHACFNKKGKLITYDREQHCEIEGTYDIKKKEQRCWKTGLREGYEAIELSTNDCGMDTW